MSLYRTEDKSTLVQVMAWCPQATSHYLSQWWPRYVSPYGVSRPQWVKWCTVSDDPLWPVDPIRYDRSWLPLVQLLSSAKLQPIYLGFHMLTLSLLFCCRAPRRPTLVPVAEALPMEKAEGHRAGEAAATRCSHRSYSGPHRGGRGSVLYPIILEDPDWPPAPHRPATSRPTHRSHQAQTPTAAHNPGSSSSRAATRGGNSASNRDPRPGQQQNVRTAWGGPVHR